MFIAKVVGNVWATRKHKSLEGGKLLLVKKCDGLTGEFYDEDAILAIDVNIDAGIGDVVLIMDEGNSARQILENKYAPVRTVVCGIIDMVCSVGNIKKWC